MCKIPLVTAFNPVRAPKPLPTLIPSISPQKIGFQLVVKAFTETNRLDLFASRADSAFTVLGLF